MSSSSLVQLSAGKLNPFPAQSYIRAKRLCLEKNCSLFIYPHLPFHLNLTLLITSMSLHFLGVMSVHPFVWVSVCLSISLGDCSRTTVCICVHLFCLPFTYSISVEIFCPYLCVAHVSGLSIGCLKSLKCLFVLGHKNVPET